jgi:hypothetical protein
MLGNWSRRIIRTASALSNVTVRGVPLCELKRSHHIYTQVYSSPSSMALDTNFPAYDGFMYNDESEATEP